MTQTAFEVLQDLITQQREAARNPFHPINDRLRKNLQDEQKQLKVLKNSDPIVVAEKSNR